jgi:hypothetical protein
MIMTKLPDQFHKASLTIAASWAKPKQCDVMLAISASQQLKHTNEQIEPTTGGMLSSILQELVGHESGSEGLCPRLNRT